MLSPLQHKGNAAKWIRTRFSQKRVALAWNSVGLTEQEGERVFLVSTTREELEAMPEFKMLEQEAEAEAAAAQQQMQQQPGVVPLAAAPAPQPGNQ